jgi:site-specific recombinase XerC
LSKKRLRLNLIKWAKDLGIIKHLTFHGARHNIATMALNMRVDLKTVFDAAGTFVDKTTKIYAKFARKLKQEVLKKLEKL